MIFERTGERRDAVEVRRSSGEPLRMHPAPGDDDYFPHDLQHLIVEEQLRLTAVSWHDWLRHCPEHELRRRAVETAEAAARVLDGMDAAERATLLAAMPRMRSRIDDVARRWNALGVGDQLALTWSPIAR